MFFTSRKLGPSPSEVSGGFAHFARALGAVVVIASTSLLTACGGGDNSGAASVNIGVVVPIDTALPASATGSGAASVNIGVFVAGQPQRDLIVGQGGSTNLALFAGDSVILEAREPVIWTLFVGGAAVGTGVEVFYAGLNLTATRLDAFTVALDTFAAFPLAAPVAVTMVATSSFDSALVARVDILITN